MSTSMKSTKAQMYSEIERLRALCDRQANEIKGLRSDAARKQGAKRSDAQLEEAAARGSQPPLVTMNVPAPRRKYETLRDVPRPLLAAFTRQYCKAHGVRSVPSDAVRTHFGVR